MGVTPRRRRSRLDQRTTRHPGYEISQRKRKRIEEVFGWMKTVGMLCQLRHRRLERVGWVFTLAAATYNLVRSAYADADANVCLKVRAPTRTTSAARPGRSRPGRSQNQPRRELTCVQSRFLSSL